MCRDRVYGSPGRAGRTVLLRWWPKNLWRPNAGVRCSGVRPTAQAAREEVPRSPSSASRFRFTRSRSITARPGWGLRASTRTMRRASARAMTAPTKGVYLNVEPKYLTDYVAETALREDHRRMAPLPTPRCIGHWVPGTSTTGVASRMGVTAGTRFWRQGTGLRAQVGQQRVVAGIECEWSAAEVTTGSMSPTPGYRKMGTTPHTRC